MDLPPLRAEDRARLDERFAHLTDRRADHEPITAADHARRASRLVELLAAHELDALLIEPGPTLEYLTGFRWHRSERLFALVVLASGARFWIAPSFEVERLEGKLDALREAAQAGPADAVVGWDEHEYPWDPLARTLSGHGVRRLALEPATRAFVLTRVADTFAGETVSGEALVAALRGVKDAHEIALLRAANEATQDAIRAVAEQLEAGTTDYQLGQMMQHAQERLGLTQIWVLPLVGPDAALPHGGPTGRKIAPGDLLLVDTGGSFHGYQSDNTRTWIFDGRPEAEVERAWHTVHDAQRRAFEALRPGSDGRAVDGAARRVIEAAGYGDGYTAFSHRLGHGIGLEGHEPPYLDGGSAVPLQPGMCFSNEPGIYLPGRFGIRIEDIVTVTADGADHFGTWQLAPTSPA